MNRIVSFNLRVNVLNDGIHAWDFRKKRVFEYLNQNQFDMIGFQEANPDMYEELKNSLLNYDHFGIGRDANGESIPIFIKKGIAEVLETKTIWLSETPLIESMVHGSKYPRIATYVVLKTKEEKIIIFFNTHLDYASDHVCLEQAKHLVNFMKEIEQKYHGALILTGDFNRLPSSLTIRYLSSCFHSIYRDKEKMQLTFHGFTHSEEGEPIDYIFYNDLIKIDDFQVIHHEKGQSFLSDHYPVKATFHILGEHHAI
jgi:endonuclease/exonuclease/phosphatase family metal-dependent hydrolase